MMIMDAKLQDEPGRLAALRRYELLDTSAEAAFDRITNLVRTVLNVPMCAVSLIDAHRQWFKSCVGLEINETQREISFCTHTIQARVPFIVADAATDPRFAQNPLVLGEPFIRSYLGVPLTSPDGYNLGSLCAIDTRPRDFEPVQIQMLESFAALVMDEMELRRIAQVDSLTGVSTRRGFVQDVDKAVSRFVRDRTPATILVLDLDHFKQVNDSFGHAAGDAVLRGVGLQLIALVRSSDSIGRLGGEEFGILLPGRRLGDAQAIAERLRLSIEKTVIDHDPPIHLTASFGIASLTETTTSFDKWLDAADQGLYVAKRTGRNRTCVAELATLSGISA